jgi:Xaa-Pro aminopeptidase
VGKENRELSQFHRASLKAIETGVKAMRPGVRTSEFVKTIDSCVKALGYRLNVPVGHYVGLDLIEARVNPEIELAPKVGAAAIIHPILSNAEEEYMFWGQTYLILENETTSLNSAPDELMVVQ